MTTSTVVQYFQDTVEMSIPSRLLPPPLTSQTLINLSVCLQLDHMLHTRDARTTTSLSDVANGHPNGAWGRKSYQPWMWTASQDALSYYVVSYYHWLSLMYTLCGVDRSALSVAASLTRAHRPLREGARMAHDSAACGARAAVPALHVGGVHTPLSAP